MNSTIFLNTKMMNTTNSEPKKISRNGVAIVVKISNILI